jgi:hypothetical protein
LRQALLGCGQVFCVGLFEEFDLQRVHGLGFGGKTQVAQQADFMGEGVDLGLAQFELGVLILDAFGVHSDALDQALRQCL